MRRRVKISGVVRKLDELGRVVMPKEFRKEHQIENGDKVEIFNTNRGILIRKETLENELLSVLDFVLEDAQEKNLDTQKQEALEAKIQDIKDLLTDYDIPWE
ncbi:MAG: AbrB/MazE/SpoVT family DNA-binding domain-containing protein [Lachnospiraceae bacterium]|jgi:AbrB family looped-hinge helix DNA binding protein|nr:AbrB/MazE/SpoVT family DNA-binding domain-containing protein [Lachnospiraceae bacterium]